MWRSIGVSIVLGLASAGGLYALVADAAADGMRPGFSKAEPAPLPPRQLRRHRVRHARPAFVPAPAVIEGPVVRAYLPRSLSLPLYNEPPPR